MSIVRRHAPALLAFLLYAHHAAAHGSEFKHDNHTMHDGSPDKGSAEYPPTYFAHPDHVAVIYSHIVLMGIAWIFILPIAVMFSISKSRFTVALQSAFVSVNAIGVLLAIIYNASTPDLYPNNAHHKIGWIITFVVLAQFLVSITGNMASGWNHQKLSRSNEQLPFLPIHTRDRRDSQHASDSVPCGQFTSSVSSARASDDSGHEAGSITGSLRSSSATTMCGDYGEGNQDTHKEYDDYDELENVALSPRATRTGGFASNALRVVSCKIWKHTILGYKFIDRIILPFGFVSLTTGISTFGRFFEGRAVFSGLAHWIKGGVFLWLGLFTLGRWCGSFAEQGWAWNLRPKPKNQKKFRPSAEFVESALIFFYGSTNIFLEHLGGWGGKWSAHDLEHLAITILFLGGGLCGMLIESKCIRNLLNATLTSIPRQPHSEEERAHLDPPETYEFSVNPMPALVILLLGIMMSSHHQASMMSTMVHKQWGNLLLGASFARALSYVLVYLRPPQSIFPSRPPTELLASFGLIAGGIIFMASSSDTVAGMIHYDLNAMFMYTVTMGLVGLLMAWEITVLAIKGWAVRSEQSFRH